MTEKHLFVVHNYLRDRDAYGFALRPQHVKRYQEYLSIYTEEETERAEKWKIFLDRQDSAADPCSSEEEFQDTLPTDDDSDFGEESASKEDSRNDKHDSGSCKSGGLEVQHVEKDSTETVGELSKEKELAEEAHVVDEHQYLREKSLRRNSESVKDEDEGFESEKENESSVESESVRDVDERFESEKEKESSVESESVRDVDERFESEKEKESSVESESDEEKKSQSVKESIDYVHIQQENEAEKLVEEADKCGLDDEKAQKETKSRSVIEWAHIRPCLASIEAMMCSRVKNVKSMQNKQKTIVEDHASSIHKSLASIEESEQNSGENDRDSEASTSRSHSIKEEEHDAQGSVSPEPFSPWYEELEVLVRLGVPKDLRGEVWQAFVGVKARRVERYYQDLLAQITNSDESSSDVQRKWKKQIEKDIPRTFPGHPALNENGRDSLRRILLAYACHNPSVGYCQAMNFFAGLLLLLMPEENAFWTLVGIIDDYFDGYYIEEMIESQVDQLVFEELMRERFPKLGSFSHLIFKFLFIYIFPPYTEQCDRFFYSNNPPDAVNHLDYLGVQVAWISGPWFLSIFVNIIPWECVLRMWDVLLFEGNRVVLFRTAFALMELYGPAIVATKDAGDAITSLQSFASSTFDSSQLVLTACMGYMSTNEARLEELRKIHRPAVLEIVEERLQKGRVWKDKKGLASKLYSFKHEGSILDEQKPTQRTDGDDESRSPSCSLILDGANVDSEVDSLPDLQEQVVWMKVELCRLLEEKRSAVMRADELEVALMEMVKEDNRLELSAKIEKLEKEVRELKQVLSDKKEQETAMLQVLMKVEQDQKLTEDARISAEQDAAAQRYAVHVLQEKNEKLATQLAQMEKKLVTAESTLEATLQYESGQNKALSSPRFPRPAPESPKKRTGFLSFGLGWRDRNKAKQPEESNSDNTSNATSEVKSPSKDSVSGQESNVSKESKTEDLLNPETRR
ncbi:PREDICTED: ecotropic viral integration site 5 protein homolog isoform X2 [Camelina sativa]|uniref:Ecotropic viral integration site 5 protein homolog isoform X2 n=1 Tax=Camelina sativa TaxID=90675 RepID=A0ABM0ZKF4_CAMSA|nr:PREDICTED: ecotropic viral integration site 5 protein homolog isoform X2 [Camelina sativa]